MIFETAFGWGFGIVFGVAFAVFISRAIFDVDLLGIFQKDKE